MKQSIGKPILAFGLALSIIGFAAAFTNNLPRKEPKITLTLSTQEVDIILQGLAELPMKTSGNVYSSIMQQAQMQLQAQQRPPLKDTTNKKKQ